MKKILVALSVVTMLLITSVVSAEQPNNTFEVKLFTGYQVPDWMVWHTTEKYEWVSTELCLAYGWLLKERWQINLEGNAGRYKFPPLPDQSSLLF